MVPTFTWGLLRSNFSFAMSRAPSVSRGHSCPRFVPSLRDSNLFAADPALPSACENRSSAPTGLAHFPLSPRACALGCILSPLRGWILPGQSEIEFLTQTLPCRAFTSRPFRAEPQRLSASLPKTLILVFALADLAG